MVPADLLQVLVELAVAGAVATALVLLLRTPLRRSFGAGVGYATWALVPVALLAVLLPAAPAPAPVVSMVLAIGNAVPQALASGATPPDGHAAAWLLLWGTGAAVAGGVFALQQRRFHRAIGQVRPRADGLLQAGGRCGLPATVGLLPPRVVVPAGFDHDYTDEQRVLMVAHERCHVRHGDPLANAAFVAARCVFWFNPLLHLAAGQFRHDQELACDQRVIACHPHARRAYGEAMFKAQLAAIPLPLGCHWGYGHPLKERIAMLRQPVPTFTRRLAGAAAVVALTLVTGYSAWAAQPASQQPVLVVSPDGVLPVPPPAPPVPPAPNAPPAPPAPAAPTMALAPPPPPAPNAAPPPPPPPMSPLPPPANRMPPPRYPKSAVEQGIDGTVVLIVSIDERGQPLDVVVEKSEPAGVFDQAAMDAAMQWRFTPEMKGGRNVPGRVRVPIRFEADGKAPAAQG